VTCELFRLPAPHDPTSFLLRLSVAQVTRSGPFSLYPGIERHLCILTGAGVRLTGNHTLTPESPPHAFAGEEVITSELLGDSVVDFNVMIDRNWGKATLAKVDGDYRFVYWTERNELWLLSTDEAWPQTASQGPAKAIAVSIKRFF